MKSIYQTNFKNQKVLVRVDFNVPLNSEKIVTDNTRIIAAKKTIDNFETKDYEEKIVESSYASLQAGVERFINETNFKNFIMILKSAGFTSSALISGNNATNMAYIIYLHGRKNKLPSNQLDGLVRQWFVMSLLTQRYSGSTESEFDRDIRQINTVGLEAYFKTIINSSMSSSFWSGNLPQELATTSTNSPFWNVYVASQVKSKTEGFLSAHVSVESLVGVKGDIHHIYPKNYLMKKDIMRYRAIVKELGNPIISTSIHDEDEVLEYSTDPELIFEKWENQIELVIDGGYGDNVPSTIIDLSGNEPEVIREGKGDLDIL